MFLKLNNMKIFFFVLCMLISVSVSADSPEILDAKAELQSSQRYNIAVTLRHPDTGWEHYADEWVVEVDGEIIAIRTLHHPHVDEQPFTRSLRDVNIPNDAKSVNIYAKCNQNDRSKGFVLHR